MLWALHRRTHLNNVSNVWMFNVHCWHLLTMLKIKSHDYEHVCSCCMNWWRPLTSNFLPLLLCQLLLNIISCHIWIWCILANILVSNWMNLPIVTSSNGSGSLGLISHCSNISVHSFTISVGNVVDSALKAAWCCELIRRASLSLSSRWWPKPTSLCQFQVPQWSSSISWWVPVICQGRD